MSKTIIELKCVDQVLTFVNTPIVASGGVGEDYLSIEFCSKWSGYTVSVFFWRQGVDPIPVLADSDGLYKVPSELTYNEGVVYFGAVGVNAENERRTSEAISYRIQEGAITENTTLPEPDVDVFDQLLAQYADVKLYVASSVDTAAAAASNAEKAASEVQTMIKEGGYIPSTEKGTPSGVASLDDTGKVPSGQLPSMDYIPTSEKGAASGVASLGTDGKVPTSQLPSSSSVEIITRTGDGNTTFALEFSKKPKLIYYLSLVVNGYDSVKVLALSGNSRMIIDRYDTIEEKYTRHDYSNSFAFGETTTVKTYEDSSSVFTKEYVNKSGSQYLVIGVL